MLEFNSSNRFGGGGSNLSSTSGEKPCLNFGFTLAEVLITLGIIGIVAAMTLPSVINKIQKKDASARLKKFYSAINQAINLSTVDNGPPSSWSDDLTYHDADELYNWFDKYIMQYMVVVKKCKDGKSNCTGNYKFCLYPGKCGATSASTEVLYVFGDGSMITAITGGGYDSETNIVKGLTIHVRMDTNGYKKPNTLGQDVFSFRISINKDFHYTTCDDHKSLTGGAVSLKGKREDLLSACKTDPQTCTCLLMYDGWEFKKDYPW